MLFRSVSQSRYEEFESPVDRLGCGEHDLVDLVRGEFVDGGAHRSFRFTFIFREVGSYT